MGQQKSIIDERGWRLVLVHPGKDESSRLDVAAAGLDGVDQISDPHCESYRSFGLGKASLWQLFRPRVFSRGVKAVIAGHRGGRLQGDVLQLPGTFLVGQGKVVSSQIARDVADLGALEALG